jgi:hypothetical protein
VTSCKECDITEWYLSSLGFSVHGSDSDSDSDSSNMYIDHTRDDYDYLGIKKMAAIVREMQEDQSC